eukprot:3654542-Pleurochrysis_carterae.AAC.2
MLVRLAIPAVCMAKLFGSAAYAILNVLTLTTSLVEASILDGSAATALIGKRFYRPHWARTTDLSLTTGSAYPHAAAHRQRENTFDNE